MVLTQRQGHALKLQKCVYSQGNLLSKTIYNANFVYTEATSLNLDYILFEEGTISMQSTSPEFRYFLKDHLGNTRVVFNDQGEILQMHDYYPFGLEFTGRQGGEIKYRYNGKELQDDVIGGIGLDWYDYGARFYDPQIGRWNVIDPMIEKHYDYSPFAYAYNNPILLIDVMGLDTTWLLDQENKPESDAAYTGSFWKETNGIINGPYTGSTFPDDDDANTLNEGEYPYNNKYGHQGGKRKGLNIVDENGNRNATGTDPKGNEVPMTDVNVHDSFDDTRRNSAGCPTVPHGDPEHFFDDNNYDWSGTYNGHTGTTGNSTGTSIVIRGQNATLQKNHLLRKIQEQSPLPISDGALGIVPDSWIK